MSLEESYREAVGLFQTHDSVYLVVETGEVVFDAAWHSNAVGDSVRLQGFPDDDRLIDEVKAFARSHASELNHPGMAIGLRGYFESADDRGAELIVSVVDNEQLEREYPRDERSC